jgi:DNA repair exonuclease SbcCD ATPase subunit
MTDKIADLVGHLERARQDTERLLSAEADRAAEMEAQANREQERADRAEQMVCDLRERLHIVREDFRGTHYMESGMERSIDAALSRTEPVAGRWVSKAEADRAVTAALDALQRTIAERDAAIAARDEAVARLTACEVAHVAEIGKVAAAERARDEVGIQLAAAQAEIVRLHKGLRNVEGFMLREWRPPAEAVLAMVRDVAAGGPSVPGDALAQKVEPSWSGIDELGSRMLQIECLRRDVAALNARIAELEGLLREAREEVDAGLRARRLLDGGGPHLDRAEHISDRITAALEASGIDADNVKDGE